MSDDHDDNDDDSGRKRPPPVSRLDRGGTRSYRVLSRVHGQYGARGLYRRHGKQLPVAQLIGLLIRHHGLTDEVRHRSICLYWPEIAGGRIANKTFPISFAERLLHVSAVSSSWVQEMQFFKEGLIQRINCWVDANRVWLGPPPLVTEIRFTLGMERREPLVDPEHATRLRQLQLCRMRPRDLEPPLASEAELDAIRMETRTIADPELRAIIEALRSKWNR